MQDLTIKGDTWGRTDAETSALHAIRADAVSDFSIAEAVVLGNGDLKGGGIPIQSASRRVTLRDN